MKAAPDPAAQPQKTPSRPPPRLFRLGRPAAPVVLSVAIATAMILLPHRGEHKHRATAIASFQRGQAALVAHAANAIERAVHDLAENLADLAAQAGAETDPAQLRRALADCHRPRQALLHAVFLADAEGRLIARSPAGQNPASAASWAEFRAAAQIGRTKTDLPAPCIASAHASLLHLAAPVRRDGGFAGAVIFAVELRKLWDRSVGGSPGPACCCWHLLDEQVATVYRLGAAGPPAVRPGSAAVEQLRQGKVHCEELVPGADGEGRLAAFALVRMGESRWYLAVTAPTAEAIRATAEQVRSDQILTLGLVVLLFVTGLVSYRSFRADARLRAEQAHSAELARTREALAESEEKYRTLVEDVNVGVFRNTPGPPGHILHVNPAMAQLFGYDSPEEMTGVLPVETYQDPRQREAMLDALRRDGMVQNLELDLVRKDGTRICCAVTARARRDEAGRFTALTGILQDITDRKRAEAARRESEAKYRSLFELSPDFIAVVGVDGVILDCNHPVTLTGRRREDILGKHFSELGVFAGDFLPEAGRHFARLAAGEVLPPVEIELAAVDGRKLWAEIFVAPLRSNGRVYAVQAIARDITARKRAEQDLRASEEKYRALSEQSVLGVAIFQDGQVKYVNRAAADLSGEPAEEILTWDIEQIGRHVHPDDRQSVLAQMTQGETIAEPRQGISFRIVTRRGAAKWVDLYVRRITYEGAPAILATLVEMTYQRWAEEALRESEERYHGLVESQQDLVVRFDPQCRLTFVNDALCRKVARTRRELLGQSFLSLVREADVPEILAAVRGLDQPPHRAVLRAQGLTAEGLRWIEWEGCAIQDDSGATVEVQAVGRDVTEQVHALRALGESEEKYRALVENADESIFTADPAGRVLFANAIGARRLGREPEDIAGLTIFDLLEPRDAERRLGYIRQVARTGQGVVFEDSREAAGTVRWFRTSMQPIRDHEGRVASVLVMGTDMTESRKAQGALRENEARYRAIVEDQTELICRFRPDCTITFVNDSPVQAANLVIADVMDAHMVYKPNSATCSRAHTFKEELTLEKKRVLVWRLKEPIGPRQAGVITYQLVVRKGWPR